VETLMLMLVTFLGWVIVSYSRAYMAGDPQQARYLRNLMLTLAAVSLLVVTNSLAIFLAAWVLTSFALHGLLALYPDRQPAVITAHKKFLVSRLGDLTLLCGVLLLASRTGSFEMDQVMNRAAGFHSIPGALHAAAILVAISAIIKCAQLPLHGWLIQVMEAPTPVSALLHAGVVNLGGFMLIRLAGVINTTPAARDLLVVVGCLTAVLSALVMTTRISIKVHLAWSTCAQMGFMLMECGLGLYGLALLHLLAHSLYKAHAFLGSGGAVQRAALKRMTPPLPPPGAAGAIAGACGGLLVAGLGALLWRPHFRMDAVTLLCVMIAGLAVSGLVAAAFRERGMARWLVLLGTAAGVSLLYFGYDGLFQSISAMGPPAPVAALVFASLCFVLLYAFKTIIRISPAGWFAASLYPWFYSGLYLDELFTRATFRLWPASPLSAGSHRRDAAQPFEAAGAGANR
jgi:NAD(P)H-quinone oxidoreductase subunit 5